MTLPFFHNYSSKKNMSLYIVSTIIIVILLSYFMIYRNMSALATVFNETSEQLTQIETDTQGSSIRSVLTIYNEYKNKVSIFHEAIPSSNRQLEFITQLEDSAARAHVEQRINFNELEENNENNYKFFTNTLQLSIIGDYKNIIEYLDTIEKQSFYININSITLSSVVEKNEDPEQAPIKKVTAFINAELYWQ